MNLTKTLVLGFLAIAWMLVALFFTVDVWLSLLGLPVWKSCVLAGLFFIAAKLAQRASKNALEDEIGRMCSALLIPNVDSPLSSDPSSCSGPAPAGKL